MSKPSVIFLLFLLLSLGYLWPWAVQQKTSRLAIKTKMEQKRTASEAATPKEKTRPIQAHTLLFPVKGKSIANIISDFGDPRAGGSRAHEGVDIVAPRGTAVLAVADGTIKKVKEGGDGGRQVWLQLNNGWEIYYAHLHAQLIEEGAAVKAGELIGTVGNTGNAQNASPHLHFCIYPSPKQAVDPKPFFEDLG